MTEEYVELEVSFETPQDFEYEDYLYSLNKISDLIGGSRFKENL